MAIHVSPVAAATFDAAAAKISAAAAAAGTGAGAGWAAALPEELAGCVALFESGEARWCSGLRIGALFLTHKP